MSCKTYLPYESGNGLVRSGGKSIMNGVGNRKNCMRVNNVSMAKFMNLIHNLPVPPYTFARNPLMGNVDLNISPENKSYSATTGLGTVLQTDKVQGPNLNNFVSYGTVGLPKGRKSYGNRSFVVVPYWTFCMTLCTITNHKELTVGRKGKKSSSLKKATSMIPEGCGHLADLYTRNQKDISLVNYKLIHLIADVKTLHLAYERIKSKPSNMTKGDSDETLDGVNRNDHMRRAHKLLKNHIYKVDRHFVLMHNNAQVNNCLIRLSNLLRAGKFRFSSSRRIQIPKPGKFETRPLSIASHREKQSLLERKISPRDKIVQKAIQLVLEGVFNPSFMDCSHGFIPGKGTHTALKQIDTQCQNAYWFIEVDISKCFDTIDHSILCNILSVRIQCDKTLALIQSALKAGYVEMGKLALYADIGTPQGSVLSPLLCNVYMHELDKFVSSLVQKHCKGSKHVQNKTYSALLQKLNNTSNMTEKREIRANLRKIPVGDPFDPNLIRVRYVRYADDFVVSVLGPHSLAVRLLKEIEEFLGNTLKLQMNAAKRVITNVKTHKAHFLGVSIQCSKHAEKPVTLSKTGKRVRVTPQFQKNETFPRVRLHAPIQDIFAKLHTRGFIQWANDGKTAKPTALTRLVNMNHSDILAYYNKIIRGILNYYSFADNFKSLGSVVRTLQMSCARTLALKYKLRFASKVFKKYGNALTDPETQKGLYVPHTYKRTRQFKQSVPIALAVMEGSWNKK
uniref:Hypothetical reverse transcriptase/maturase n=1 Tax=Chromochloris zofingiensis TaxID=31302 RepID=A0A076VKH0_9CHLO|nr:hypothetical reverse transcriptase/maturase [Chromochloris zofingiensis]AIK29126.1 hypothetical reverse transcriptase/maturase [Chromochloris zofingiensis]